MRTNLKKNMRRKLDIRLLRFISTKMRFSIMKEKMSFMKTKNSNVDIFMPIFVKLKSEISQLLLLARLWKLSASQKIIISSKEIKKDCLTRIRGKSILPTCSFTIKTQKDSSRAQMEKLTIKTLKKVGSFINLSLVPIKELSRFVLSTSQQILVSSRPSKLYQKMLFMRLTQGSRKELEI